MTRPANTEGGKYRQTIRTESRHYFAVFGAHIANTRKSLGFTQKELADKVGVSQQAMFAYEMGDRRVSVVIVDKLAKIFGVTVDALIHLSKPPSVRKQRLSPRAMRHAERLQALPKSSQRFVIKIIDSLERFGQAKRP